MPAPRKNYFNLVIGTAFVIYGGYRLYSFSQGAAYSTFRMIVAVGFVLLGGWDLYRFFKPPALPEQDSEETKP